MRGVARAGLDRECLFPAERCELLERMKGVGAFGGFEAWQYGSLERLKEAIAAAGRCP